MRGKAYAIYSIIRKAVLEGVPEPVEGRGFKPKFLVKDYFSIWGIKTANGAHHPLPITFALQQINSKNLYYGMRLFEPEQLAQILEQRLLLDGLAAETDVPVWSDQVQRLSPSTIGLMQLAFWI